MDAVAVGLSGVGFVAHVRFGLEVIQEISPEGAGWPEAPEAVTLTVKGTEAIELDGVCTVAVGVVPAEADA